MRLDEILKPKTESEIAEGLSMLPPDEKLRQCASNGYMEGVLEALSENANINFKLENGDTPLDLAIMAKHYEMSEFLVQNGAWISDTSLLYATENRKLFILLLNNLHQELCNCRDLSDTIQISVHFGRLDLIILIEDRINEVGLLSGRDKAFLQKMKLMADDISILKEK